MKKLIFGVLFAFGVLIPVANAHGQQVFFEITGANTDSIQWGSNDLDKTRKIAQKYTATENRRVCSIRFNIRLNNNIPLTNIEFDVMEGGTNPQNGTLTNSGTSFGGIYFRNNPGYQDIQLFTCLNMQSGQTYWFVWKTAQDSIDTLISQYRPSDEFPNSSYWQFDNAAQAWVEYPDREWAFALISPNIIADKEPIIIVPGTMGSYLNKTEDSEEVWTDTNRMFNVLERSDSYLDYLRLNNEGQEFTDKDVYPSGIIESEGVLAFSRDFYGPLIDLWVNQGYVLGTDLFIFPYDWRKEIESNAGLFDATFNQAVSVSPTGQVNVITHSQGGLIIKEYLRSYSGAGDNINNLVMVATPNLGTPKTFKLLSYGDDMGMKFFGLGLNQERAKIISQNFPSIYQMLPTEKYFETFGSYIEDRRGGETQILNYEETKQLMEDDGRNTVLLNNAEVFHGEREDEPINIDPAKVHNVIGCHTPGTMSKIILQDNNDIDVEFTNGDGTVALPSTLYLTENQNNYFSIYNEDNDITTDHLGLVKEEAPLALINNVILGESLNIPGISTSRSACESNPNQIFYYVVSTHSPVDLHIYDLNNNHVGVNTDGNFETQIRNSQFFKVGENNFAILPAGPQYRVEIDAYASGNFDLRIRGVAVSETIEAVKYIDIPIVDSNLEAQLNFSSLSNSLELNIDENGNGTYESRRVPDEVVGLEPLDLLGPDIVINSPNLSSYTRAEIVPVQVTVTDAISEVATTSYTFDGAMLTSSSIDLFSYGLGSHSFSVISFDSIGNKSSKSFSFLSIATINSTISDINRAHSLGWITSKQLRDSLITKLRLTKKTGGRIDKLLLKATLLEIEYWYKKGVIKRQAYDILKEDINWLLK